VEAVAEAGFPAQHRPVVGLVHVVFAYVDYVAVGELLTLQLFTNQHALVKNEHVTAFNSLIVVSFDFQFAVFDQSPVVCQSLICGVPLDDVLLQVVDHCQVFAVSGGLVYEPCHIQHGLSSSPQIIVLLVIGICMFDQLVQEQMVLEDPLHGHRQHVPQLEPPVVVLLFVRHYDRVKTLVGVAQFLQEIRGASQICTVPPVHQEPLPPLHKRQTELDRGISKLLQLVVERRVDVV
jgi:hypothetical protein